MKHQVKQLLEDTREILQGFDDEVEKAKEKWNENNAPKFRALRDMLTERLRRGKVVTEDDVIEAFGQSDLAPYTSDGVFYDHRVGAWRGRRHPVARLVTSRPNVKTEIYYEDLVNFATLLLKLREDDGLPMRSFTRAHRFVVTDQELTELGFNRFPAILNRIKEHESFNRSYAIEVRG